MQELKNPLLLKYLIFKRLFHPGFCGLFIGYPDCNPSSPTFIPYPSTLRLIYLPLNTFDKCHPENGFCPGETLRQAKQRQALESILHRAIRQIKTHNHKFLRIRSMLLPLALATCARNVGCYLRGHCSSAEQRLANG